MSNLLGPGRVAGDMRLDALGAALHLANCLVSECLRLRWMGVRADGAAGRRLASAVPRFGPEGGTPTEVSAREIPLEGCYFVNALGTASGDTAVATYGRDQNLIVGLAGLGKPHETLGITRPVLLDFIANYG